jgi:ankyrin repeat protein
MADDVFAVFTARLTCREAALELQSDTAALTSVLEELSRSARSAVKAFLVLDADVRARVDSTESLQTFITSLREKLREKRSPDEKLRLQALLKKQDDGQPLTPPETAELHAIRLIEHDIVLVQPEGSGKAAYDAEKLRSERLSRMSAAESSLTSSGGTGSGPRAKRNPGSIVQYITLRFFADQDQNAKENGVEINLPYAAGWSEVCDILRKRFQSIVHFRYFNDKNAWVEVRSEKELTIFRTQMGEDGLEKGSSHVVAQVQLLPFGSGAPPVADALQEGFLLSSKYQAMEVRSNLLKCVEQSRSDEAGAADTARGIIQSSTGPASLLEETDDIGRTALHLAAMQGRRQLVQALLSGAQQTRKAAACARDLRGRTPLHYAMGEQVAVSLLQAKADALMVDHQGCAPLHVCRDPDVAHVLIKAKTHQAPNDAAPDFRDKMGRTALHCHAASTWAQSGEMVAWLVLKTPGSVNSAGAALEIDVLAVDAFGRTALHDAASINNWEALDVLFKAGDVLVDVKDSFGLSPLHCAGPGAIFPRVMLGRILPSYIL